MRTIRADVTAVPSADEERSVKERRIFVHHESTCTTNKGSRWQPPPEQRESNRKQSNNIHGQGWISNEEGGKDDEETQ